MSCPFKKQRGDSVLKLSWYGNIALRDCLTCCMRWRLTINGSECADPGPIDGAIYQTLTGRVDVEYYRPASIAGVCRGITEEGEEGAGLVLLPAGDYVVGIEVGQCDTFLEDFPVVTGHNSASRFIVEEVPDTTSRCQT